MKTILERLSLATRTEARKLASACSHFYETWRSNRNPFNASPKEVKEARLFGFYFSRTNGKPAYLQGSSQNLRERFSPRRWKVRESTGAAARVSRWR
jgi:hypothetical protein